MSSKMKTLENKRIQHFALYLSRSRKCTCTSVAIATCDSGIARIAPFVSADCCAIDLASLAIGIGGITIKCTFATTTGTGIVVRALVAVSASDCSRFSDRTIGASSLSVNFVVVSFAIAISADNIATIGAITVTVVGVIVIAVGGGGFTVGVSCCRRTIDSIILRVSTG